MDFKIPREGVQWSAKYSPMGCQRFSSKGIGIHLKPELKPASDQTMVGTGLFLRRHSDAYYVNPAAKSKQNRIRSAPVRAVHPADGANHGVGTTATTNNVQAAAGKSHYRNFKVKQAFRLDNSPSDDTEVVVQENSSSEAKITVTASPPQRNPPRDPDTERPPVFKEEPPALEWQEKCMEWVSEITSGMNIANNTKNASVSRPTSARSRDWAKTGLTPLLGKAVAYPDVTFANELWYRKGHKHLKNWRASESTQSNNARETHESLLHCSTASSRARQVTTPPAIHTEPNRSRVLSLPPQPHRRHSSPSPAKQYSIPPDRFKGTRTVTPEELKQIVQRLSTSDPTRVPESGHSKNSRPSSNRSGRLSSMAPSRRSSSMTGRARSSNSWQGVRAAVGT